MFPEYRGHKGEFAAQCSGCDDFRQFFRGVFSYAAHDAPEFSLGREAGASSVCPDDK